MNYALDALWWRLTHPDVRALASLLTAPPPWHSGCEISVRELLGEKGFRYLLALNDEPSALVRHLTEDYPFGGRLGVYAESLLAFWLDNAPHCRLLAHNLPVSDDDRTLGALDFVAKINGRLHHIELACKYYGAADGDADVLAGLNDRDTWLGKAEKLNSQIALAHNDNGRNALSSIGLAANRVISSSVLRGMLFAAQGVVWQFPLNPYAWQGHFCERWPSEGFSDNQRYYLFPRLSYLAPVRVRKEDTLDWEAVKEVEQGLVAVLNLRPDGFWHETGRVMKRQGADGLNSSLEFL